MSRKTMKRTITTILILLALCGSTQVLNLGNSRNATLYDNSGIELTTKRKDLLIYRTDSAEFLYRFMPDEPCRIGRTCYQIEVTFSSVYGLDCYLTEPHEYELIPIDSRTYEFKSGLVGDIWVVYVTGDKTIKITY